MKTIINSIVKELLWNVFDYYNLIPGVRNDDKCYNIKV